MKIKTTLLVIAILTSISCNALNYFWVGGSGSWSDFNNHWATTSGGNIFHNQVPQSTDNVYFDAFSFTAPGQTVAVDQTVVICADMDWTGVTHNPTLYGDYTTTLTIYGSLKFVIGMTFNFAGQISFEATTTGKTITTAGVLINTSLTFNGIGGGYTLQDALTCNYAIYLNNGTLNTNNQTVTIGSFFSTTNSTRVLNMGSSIFNLTNPWDMLWYITNTGMTLNSGTSAINVVTTFGDAYFAGGGFTYNNLSFTQGANGIIYDNNIFNDVFFANNGTTNGGTFHDVSFAGNAYINNSTFNNVTIAKDGDIQGNNSFNDLTFSAGYTYTLQSGNTQTITNSLSVTGNCGALINILKSSTPGLQATISKASGAVTVSYVTLKDINATGGGTFIANNAIDLGNNTGWTINTLPSKNLYWVGNAGNWDDGNHWSTTSGGLPSGCSPTPVDNVFFDANSFSQTGQTLTVNAPTAYCYNMDWTGVSNNPTISGINTLKIYGSLTLASAMTFNFGGILSFEATTMGHTITTAGVSINTSLTFNGSGGGWALQDDLTTPYLIYLNKGSLNTNNQTVNAAGLWSNVTTTRTLTTGTSTFNLSDETMWYIYPAGITINASGSTINGTSTVVAQHFHGSGYTYYDLFFTGGTSGNIYGNNTFHNVSFAGNAFIYGSTFNNVTMAKEGEINASNTFNNLTLSPGYTYTLQANQTQTILNSLTVNGNCGALINILKSSTPGLQATISKASGAVTVSFVTLKDIKATGGATFTANNAIDLGNNTGWTINTLPSKNLYWIGNGGNWDDGNHWSITSGGMASGCSPTPMDNVFFDANSFSQTGQAVTVNAPTAYFNNMDWTGVSHNPALNGSTTIKIYGSLTLAAAMAFNFDGSINFEASSTGKTITTAGIPINTSIIFNGNGGWTLQDELTCQYSIYLNKGTLNTNNQTVNASAFWSNTTDIRALNAGTSTINLSGEYMWYIVPQGMTINASASIIKGIATGWYQDFYGGGITYNDILFTAGSIGSLYGNNTFHDASFAFDGYIHGGNFHDVSFASNATINGPAIFNNVTIAKQGDINGNNTFNNLSFSPGYAYTLQSGGTQTVSNICAQGTGALPIRIQSNNAGVAATISKASGTMCWDYVRVSDITGTGGATFNAGLAPTNSEDMGGNTGLVFTGACTPVSCAPCTSPSITAHPANSTICAGNNFVFAIGATGTGLTYQWQLDQGAGFTNLTNTAPYSGVTTNTLNIAAATTGLNGYQYRCIVIGTCAPVRTSNAATLAVNMPPTVNVNSETICSGQTATLTASGAVSYVWSIGGMMGDTNNPISVSPITTTTYTVTGITNGCSNTAIATVTVNSLPTVSVNSATICSGQTATLTASGATTYTWSNGATTNPISVSPASTTSYTVTGTTNGCSNTAIAAVTVNPLPTVTVNSTTVCSGQTTTLTASGATSYTWSNGATTNVISISPATTTSYTVTGATNGCSNTAVATVTVNPLPTVTGNSTTVCSGQTATLSASGAINYTWSTGANTNSITVSPSTTTSYTVTGTTNGCSNTAIATVTVNPLPTITVNSTTVCSGQTATLNASGATNYSWSNGATTNPISVSPVSTTSYTVTGTTNGCSNTAIATVTVNPLPTVNVNSATVCSGQTATLTATGATTYTWSTGATTNVISVSPTTTTSYTVTGATNGCSNTVIAAVTVNPLPTVTVNSTTVCSGQTATLNASGATNYSWTNGSTTNPISVSPVSTTSYTVTGTTNGCSNTAVAAVTVNPLPTVTVNSTTVCLGQTATLTASGATNYIWSNGATTNSNTVSPLITTTYTVIGTTNGCSNTAIATVTVNPLPIVSVNSATINSGQTATLTASGATSYSWSTGETINSIAVSPATTATYTVTGTTNDCSNSVITTVTVNSTSPDPQVSITPDGLFDNIFDKDGHKYALNNLIAGVTAPNGTKSILIPCSSGYFNLYYDIGSGMEGSSPVEVARRNVICKVLSDISAFIPAPVGSPLETGAIHVNLWVKNIADLIPNSSSSDILGAASAFYVIPSPSNPPIPGGIADNEVYKTIVSGIDSYTNFLAPLIVGNSPPAPATFYHGLMTFNFSNPNINWETNLSVTSTPNNDLYTVALHEITHALGIASLIDYTGVSKFGSIFPYYSSYDRFLTNQSGNHLILPNSSNCSLYDFNFNPAISNGTSILHPGCTLNPPENNGPAQDHTAFADRLLYSGSVTLPIYTPSCFEKGSSFSHFEDEWYPMVPPYYGDDNYFTMSNSQGAGTYKRFLKPEERKVLCDLGYRVNDTYGGPGVYNSSKSYGTGVCPGRDVVGINDGFIGSAFQFISIAGGTLPINFGTILGNDVEVGTSFPHPANFECLEVISGNGTVSATSGTSTTILNFNAPTTAGIILLRYVPISHSGQRGNITYIFIYNMSAFSCTPNACNMVPNGDFEEHSGNPIWPGQINFTCGWGNANIGTCDYFHALSPYTIPPAQNLQVPCNSMGVENDKLGLQAYAGIAKPSWGSEYLYTKLSSPLMPFTTYQLTLDASLAEAYSTTEFPLQVTFAQNYIPTSGLTIAPPPPGLANIVVSASAPINNFTGWTPVTIIFTTGGTLGVDYGQDFIIIHAASLPPIPVTPATAGLFNCFAYQVPHPAAFGNSYIYIDNVVLQASPVIFTPPTSICLNQPLALNSLVTISGGTFSGPGVTSILGEWTFTPASAGIGTHTVTYTYTNNLGCIMNTSAVFNVVNSNITFSVNPPTPTICAGQMLTLTASGASNYTWQPGALAGSTVNVSPLSTTTYTVTATNAIGCSASQLVTVNVPTPTVTVNSPTICAGQIATLTANGAANYAWSFGATTNSISVFPATTTSYTVTGTSNGCSKTAVATVTVNPLPTVTVNSSTICVGNSVILSAFGANSYSWSPNTTNPYFPNFNQATVSPTITTTYTVTGSDNNHCSNTAVATVAVISVSVNSPTICIGQSATLTATGIPNFTWSTGATTNSISVTPTVTSSYTVAGTSSGCASTAIATVTVKPLPIADFTFPPFDNVEDLSTVPFTNFSTNATSYTWSFMDGTTSPAVYPSHIFTYPGYYRVTLSATNICGASTISKDIYIIPSATGYGILPTCLTNFSYDNAAHNAFVPAGDNKSISGSTVWPNTSYIIRIKGTLTIQAGASLTISNNTLVEFGPQGKIIVMPGGLLTIDGATLRGTLFHTCNGLNVKMMWQGIEVWGKANTVLPGQQGKIIIKNSAFIEDAYNGVMLGKSKLVIDQFQANSFQINGRDPAFGGGIIQATSSTFNRCAVSIKVWEYPYHNNLNFINSNKFICKTAGVNSAMLDPYFITTTSSTGNHYLNTNIAGHNPFYNQNDYNPNIEGRSLEGIYLFGRGTIAIRDNIFDYSAVGVFGSNARFNVIKGTGTGNSFLNNIRGIKISNISTSAIDGHTFSYSTFKNFYTGIHISGGKNEIINNNRFNTSLPLGSQVSNKTGIQLDITNFNIVDNNFTHLQNGIICNSSGNTASLIGYQSGGNIFTNCNLPIGTSGNNSMLNIRCNNFDNSSGGLEYSGKNWNIQGKLPNQGFGSTTNKKAPAGNRFQIKSPVRNQIAAITSPVFRYFHHIEAITKPSKFSPLSNFIIMQNSVSFTSVIAACTPGPIIICCHKQMLQAQTDAITLLKQEYINMQNTIDQGQTSTLLAAIQNNNTPVNTLKNQLISKSPLSDTVLTKLINRPSPLPAPMLRDVLKPNSPVSEKVYPHLQAKLDNMPTPFADSISKYQVVNSAYRTLTSISLEIAVAENLRQSILNDAVNYYVDNDSVPQAIALLELETNKEAKQGLVGAYIDQGNYSSALLKLNSIPLIADEDIDFKNLYSMYINLAVQQKMLWDIDSLQLQMVRDIASVCPSTLASVNASAVLAIVFGENIAPCPDNETLRSMTNNSGQQSQQVISLEDIEYLGNNIPNPFNNSTQIPYFLPTGSSATLNVYGIRGELIKTYTVSEGSNKLEVSLTEYSNGLYFYTLNIDEGRIIRYKKMILNK